MIKIAQNLAFYAFLHFVALRCFHAIFDSKKLSKRDWMIAAERYILKNMLQFIGFDTSWSRKARATFVEMAPAPLSIGNGAINKTRICSTFNAIYLTVLAVNVLWDSSFWIDYQLPQAYPPQLDHLYTMLAAYSIYDMACMTTTGEHWSMWVHHVLSLWGAVAIMVGFFCWVQLMS